MPKTADIIVNNTSVELDRTFSYLIPKGMEKSIEIGFRVLVPFGKANNKIEGFVVDIHDLDTENIINLKEISDLVDAYPIFDKKMLQLAKWMKRSYMCTLLECLKCIIPTGIGIKTTKYLAVNNSFSEKLSPKQTEVIKILAGLTEISQDELIKNYKVSPAMLKKLVDIGAINVENKISSSVKDKLQKIASLNISIDEANVLLGSMPDKSYAQKRVISLLIDNECIMVSDLVTLADTSYSTVNSLYKKGIIDVEEIEIFRDPTGDRVYKSTVPHKLTDEQSNALLLINESVGKGLNENILIHGITGSGKTEVYLQSIDNVIKNGFQAIVLVPEISLTPQMVERFKSRFGDSVAVIHSKLSLGERYDQWKKIKNGQVSVVVGARSAIFAPFNKLKLIIIDEEHEPSYKSESKPKYNAIEIAQKRAELENCVVVLGSATPSINTYYKAQCKKYKLVKMLNRVNQCILPTVEIIDMRKELEDGNRSIFSRMLYDELVANIKNNEQSILFLNRRGFSTFVSCRQCGLVLKCPNCNISLTYHSYNNRLMCHYCGYEIRNPSTCPSCQSKYIKYFGTGTQKVEEEIRRILPNASVLRMDVDTTGTKHSHQRILDTFRDQNINILIGTQMIAKGLDFPNVTLVGVISADISLNIDDFRASERTFQLLTQVAGRAGRGEKQGRVVIQTYQPDSFSILSAKYHDYNTFYSGEISIRESLVYPPFSEIVSIIVSHSDNETARAVTGEINNHLKKELAQVLDTNIYIIFAPTPAPLSRIKQMYRWRILIKVNTTEGIKEILRETEKQFYNKANINIDINSNNMM